jgi:Glycosyltransferase 61
VKTGTKGWAHGPSDRHEQLPPSSLEITEPRELLAHRSRPFAYEADGTIARDTLEDPTLTFGYGLDPGGPLEDDLPIEAENGPAAWAGQLRDHFGHFLTESVGRLWALVPGRRLEAMPAVFGARRLPPYAQEWLGAFGARPVLLPEHAAVRFEAIAVPERSWRLDAWIAPELRDTHLHARAGLRVPATPGHDVLWLSRSRMPRERVAFDECLLEWILGDRVRPVHLETMSLGEQVGLLESCRAVAGVMGSAFHALLMTVDTPDSLYLGPPFARVAYPAQHRLLGGRVAFAAAVPSAAQARRVRQTDLYFPQGHRIAIPDALTALDATVLPGLCEEPRVAALARRRRDGYLSEIDAAVLDVVREPFSAPARNRLGAMFEEQDLERCASEQFEFASLVQGYG